MAYNQPINYNGPNPTTVPQQNYLQSQPQAPMQTMILVNSEQEVVSWTVLPGNSLFFMDSNQKRFYIKSVDFSGIPTIRKFSFEEIVDQPEKQDFITREEFEKRLSSFERVSHKQSFPQKKGDKVDG